jgi:hypothetical protein
MAEQVFDKVSTDDVGVATKMDAAKWFSKMADYEPKQNIMANAGSGFQLVINFNGSKPEALGGITVDQQPDTATNPSLLDSPPAYIALHIPNNTAFMTAYDTDELQPAEFS